MEQVQWDKVLLQVEEWEFAQEQDNPDFLLEEDAVWALAEEAELEQDLEVVLVV
jgi:hypothetical protein